MSVICSCSWRCTGKRAPGRNSYTVTVAPCPSNARRSTPGYGVSATSSSNLPVTGSLIDERHDAAGRRLAAFDGDRKRADQAPPPERVLDVAAHVLDVGDAGAERHAMHHEDVVLGEDVVHALGDVPLERLGRVGALVADRGVHRVVPGAAVEAGPGELHVDDPLSQAAVAARVTEVVALLVLLRAAVEVAVVTGVVDEDVTAPDVHAARDHLGRDDGPVVALVGDVDDDPFPAQPVDRHGGDVGTPGDDVHLAVEVRPRMERQLEPL